MPPALAFINPCLTTRNVGDLFIEDSVKRILVYDRGRSIDVDPRKAITRGDIERINATDAAVIVGTNLWYRRLPKPGRWQLTLGDLRRIRVPIVPLGVGTTRHDGEDNGFEPETLAQIRLIHQRCAVASARDQRTVEALREAGIDNVAMTGCPTLYRSLSPVWRLRPRSESRHVAVTVRKGQAGNVRRLIGLLRRRGLQPIVAAQQRGDNFLRSWLPWLRRPATTLYEYRLGPYLELVEQGLGAIGWRLHGNMLHLAHGNPAAMFANCSRAQSFCESFSLPYVASPDHRRLGRNVLEEQIDRLLDPATFARFPARYAEHRARMAAFLDANRLEHRLHGNNPPPAPHFAARGATVADLNGSSTGTL